MFSFANKTATTPATSSAANTTGSSSFSFNLNTSVKPTAAPTALTNKLTSSTANTAPAISVPSKAVQPPDSKVDVKEDTVNAEILKDVTAFKEYTKKQKEESNEIARYNTQPLHQISEDVKGLSDALLTISSCVKRNISSVKKLRHDLTNELQHAENADITQKLNHTMQLDNVLPVKYFQEIIEHFETNMNVYQVQIKDLEQHLHVINNPSCLTAQDISTALAKMQSAFITLAANLYSIHSNVSRLKEQFLIYRRLVYGDTNDMFASSKNDQQKIEAAAKKQQQRHQVTSGDNLSNVVALAMASVMQQQQPNQQFNASATAGSTASTGLFNTKPAGSATNSGGLFFGKPAASGGLFGAKPAATGGLLGAKSTTTGGGLFGAAKPVAAPNTAGSLFSSTKPAAASGGLFGSGASKSLFGGSGTTSSTAAGTLFGGAAASTGSTGAFGGGSSSAFNSSAGVTFGGSAAGSKLNSSFGGNSSSASKHNSSFDLKLPANAKRNKS